MPCGHIAFYQAYHNIYKVSNGLVYFLPASLYVYILLIFVLRKTMFNVLNDNKNCCYKTNC